MIYDAATLDSIKLFGTASHSFDSMKFIELEHGNLLWGELGDQARGVLMHEFEPTTLERVGARVVFTSKAGHSTTLEEDFSEEQKIPAFTCGPYDSERRRSVYDEAAGGWVVT